MSVKVSLQTTIYSLANRGWSQRRISNNLGINRETVRRYLRLANPSISIASSEDRSSDAFDLQRGLEDSGLEACTGAHYDQLALHLS
jgi:DNA-binding transcriptional regulator LsrR (DeoR family)